MQEHLVSILMPVYNSERTIAVAIESCLQQTYRNIEILVLDDASTDNTVAVAEKYRQIRVLKHDLNKGTAAARNTLLREARGEFIAWLDADDTMMPERIQKQLIFMQRHPEVDIAGSWILTDNISLPKKKLPLENRMITAHLWFKNCMIQPSVISRNFYTSEHIFYDERFYYMQDYELWLRLRNRKVFANIPEFLTRYHFSSAIETKQKHSRFKDERIPEKLWELKWKSSGFDLDEGQRRSLTEFLSSDGKIANGEARRLKMIFNKMANDKGIVNVKEHLMMLHLYRLLVFKRLGISGRMRNLDLLGSLPWYCAMKRMYLIQ